MPEEKTYRIGRYELILPADHALDHYQKNWRLYDLVLGDIAQVVFQKYPDATAIDIGANVGDTAALMCRDQNFPVLCIEGSPLFLSFLRRNLERLPAGIEVAPSLVGPVAGSVSSDNLKEQSGTASLKIGGSSTSLLIPVRPLADILMDHPRFLRPRLLKSDTDGSDFDILLSSLDLIRKCRPVLYFEYDPTRRTDGCAVGLQLISELNKVGYQYFLVYDNFGNLMDGIIGDASERFAHLNRYIMSHVIFGRQIYYLDICACTEQDEDLAKLLYSHQSNLIDTAIAVGRNPSAGSPAT
jgi:FkbM family methyltransferase